MGLPNVPNKPVDKNSIELIKHLTSAQLTKKNIMEDFKNELFGSFFVEELLQMDVELMILNYSDPNFFIIGELLDFGTKHPQDFRNVDTRSRR